METRSLDSLSNISIHQIVLHLLWLSCEAEHIFSYYVNVFYQRENIHQYQGGLPVFERMNMCLAEVSCLMNAIYENKCFWFIHIDKYIFKK